MGGAHEKSKGREGEKWSEGKRKRAGRQGAMKTGLAQERMADGLPIFLKKILKCGCSLDVQGRTVASLTSILSRKCQKGRTASLRQILLKSLQSQPRYGDFSRWRPPPFWICEISNFKRSDASWVSNCVTVPNFVEIARTTAKICEFQYYTSLA